MPAKKPRDNLPTLHLYLPPLKPEPTAE